MPPIPTASTSTNPLIDRYLTNPLTFKPGRHTSIDSTERPASYIVLSKQKKSRTIAVPSQIPSAPNPGSSNSGESMKPKPRSMAEAVAAYTGKKFLTKSEKKLLNKQKKEAKVEIQQDEDMGEAFLSNSDGDSHYESASEFLDAKDMESPFSGFSETNTATPENENENENDNEVENDDSDEDDEDDGDFDEQEESPESDSESESDPRSDKESSTEKVDEDEDLEKLKYDLKSDAAANMPKRGSEDEDDDEDDEEEEVIDPSKSNTTPPTSPEDEDEVKQDSVGAPLSKFYDLGESSDDRGSNNSTRIYKNWRELNQGRPVGLLNHGVTCYMNSAIQALVHIPALQHYLNDINNGKYNEVLKTRSVSHTLADLSKRMWGLDDTSAKGKPKQSKYINPKKIIQRLDDINCMMSEWQQEDSHEYFMSLMSRLQEDSTPKGQKLNQSIIYDIFGGLLDQRLTCLKCNNVSETKQEFYDLSLGLNKKRPVHTTTLEEPNVNGNKEEKTVPVAPKVHHNKYSIEKSIRDFFSNELIKIDKLDKSSGYYCEKCKERTLANKISFITRSPETLTIHLKRFKFNGNSSSKVKQSISYSKYLDLTDYTTDKSPTKYKLVSVIVHEGRSISSGHYVSHCLQPDGTWSTYDDEYINKINERDALSDPAAYVLVYTKLTPKNKRSVREESEMPNKRRKV